MEYLRGTSNGYCRNADMGMESGGGGDCGDCCDCWGGCSCGCGDEKGRRWAERTGKVVVLLCDSFIHMLEHMG